MSRIGDELAQDVAAFMVDGRPRPDARGRFRSILAEEAWLPDAAVDAARAAAPDVDEETLRRVLLAVFALPCGSCHPCDRWSDYAQLVYATAAGAA